LENDEERIKKDLIESMRYFDQLRTKLTHSLIEKASIECFMRENDLKEEWEIERCIEEQEYSIVCGAADELNVSVIDLNLWVCETK